MHQHQHQHQHRHPLPHHEQPQTQQQQQRRPSMTSSNDCNNSSLFTTTYRLQSLKMTSPHTPIPTAATCIPPRPPSSIALPPSLSPSPPDFDDFAMMPCRYFKSSFARSLSLNNATSAAYQMHCKTPADHETATRGGISRGKIMQKSNEKNSKSNSNKGENPEEEADEEDEEHGQEECPPLPQRLNRPVTWLNNTNQNNNNNNNAKNEVISGCGKNKSNDADNLSIGSNGSNGWSSSDSDDACKPPALPARRPITGITPKLAIGGIGGSGGSGGISGAGGGVTSTDQFRNLSVEASATAAIDVNHGHQCNEAVKQQQSQQQHQRFNQNHCNNFRRKIYCPNTNSGPATTTTIWPIDLNTDQQAYADSSLDDPRYETASANDGHHRLPMPMMPQAMSVTATATTATETGTVTPPSSSSSSSSSSTTSSYDIHHSQQRENTMNVEAVILQNQVDTLQWQLKQVETSCEMYRAVMEEVARFLERYHNQRQQQLQNRNSLERSKSLYQVYGDGDGDATNAGGGGGGVTGGHVRNGNSIKNTTATTAAIATNCDIIGYQRTRSSTNLSAIVTPASTTTATATMPLMYSNVERNYDDMAPSSSYSAFKDFTWRRSPKKNSSLNGKGHLSHTDADEKLSQEAFRLSRTIHNLLNTSTQQPDLTHHRNSVAALSLRRLSGGRVTPTGSTGIGHGHGTATKMLNASTVGGGGATSSECCSAVVAAPVGVAASSRKSGTATAPATASATTNTTIATTANANAVTPPNVTAEMLFLRSNAMRDSRLSLRSSTDSSVHSTISSAASSSSKMETDEEAANALSPYANAGKQLQTTALLGGCTTEDESGFSSISSFQDIGVPLSSTMISIGGSSGGSSTYSSGNLSNNNDHHTNSITSNAMIEYNLDSRNSTLKATAAAAATATTTASHPNNIVGLPLRASHEIAATLPPSSSSSSSSSSAKTYRNAGKYQRFSTLSNEDSSTVLWV